MSKSMFNTSIYNAFNALVSALISADSTSDILNSKKADIDKKIADENKLLSGKGYHGSVMEALKLSYHTVYSFDTDLDMKHKKLSLVMYKDTYAHNVLSKILQGNKPLMEEYKTLYSLYCSALSEDIEETEEKPSMMKLQKYTQDFVNQLKLGEKFFILKSDVRFVLNTMIAKIGKIRNTFIVKQFSMFDDVFSMVLATKLNGETFRVQTKQDEGTTAKKKVPSCSVVKALTEEQIKVVVSNLWIMKNPEASTTTKSKPEASKKAKKATTKSKSEATKKPEAKNESKPEASKK